MEFNFSIFAGALIAASLLLLAAVHRKLHKTQLERARLLDVAHFYASPSAWARETGHKADGSRTWEPAVAEVDRGRVARSELDDLGLWKGPVSTRRQPRPRLTVRKPRGSNPQPELTPVAAGPA
jgi:hypothetical protein